MPRCILYITYILLFYIIFYLLTVGCFVVAVWPESPYRTRQMRGMLAKLPVDNLFVVEWLITRRVINRVLMHTIPTIVLHSSHSVLSLNPSHCGWGSVEV